MAYSCVLIVIGGLLCSGAIELSQQWLSVVLGVLFNTLGVFGGLNIEDKLNSKVEDLEKELKNFENMFFLKTHDTDANSIDDKKN